MRTKFTAGAVAILLGSTLALGGCNTMMSGMSPTGMAPTMRTDAPTPQNQQFLDAHAALGAKPLETLTPDQARKGPTFADAVKKVLHDAGQPTTPPPGTVTSDISVRGAAGLLHALSVKPTNVSGPLPVIVYYHGGGWVIADSKVYESSARALAMKTGAMVISVDYRRAPEAKFPAQHDDALAAYRYIVGNAASMGGDPRRIAIAGESAGGNLAIATAIAARNMGLPMPRHILSVYPIAGTAMDTPSYMDAATAKPLSKAGMQWFFSHVTNSPSEWGDPRLNLIASDFRGLPAVTIVAAELDPLRSEGEILTNRMRAAGVRVERREWRGTTHEFFGADAVMPEAREAQDWASGRLRAALAR